MSKYVIMIETDKFPDVGNCDNCELHCQHYISSFDKWTIIDHGGIKYAHLNGFYCPIRAVVDVETYMKMKEEHPDLGEPKQIECKEE